MNEVMSVKPVTLEPTTGNIGTILQIAVERGVDVGTLERLVALHERVTERQSAAEFNSALAAFQSECPSIAKTSRAKIATRSGGEYEYRYAELDQIATVARPILQKHGLSYSWDSDMSGQVIVCTCTVRHIGGHSQSAKFSTPIENSSAMSLQQKHASALTYARRQSLIQALGLTTTDADDDAVSHEKIGPSDVAEIEEGIVSSGSDRAKFLAYMRIASVDEMPLRDLARARAALKAKAGKSGGAK